MSPKTFRLMMVLTVSAFLILGVSCQVESFNCTSTAPYIINNTVDASNLARTCSPYAGPVVISPVVNAEITDLPSTIEGFLLISDNAQKGFTELNDSAQSLEYLGGSLTVENCATLTTLAFGQLNVIEGNLSISNNINLNSVNFSKLSQIKHDLIVDGPFALFDLSSLTQAGAVGGSFQFHSSEPFDCSPFDLMNERYIFGGSYSCTNTTCASGWGPEGCISGGVTASTAMGSLPTTAALPPVRTTTATSTEPTTASTSGVTIAWNSTQTSSTTSSSNASPTSTATGSNHTKNPSFSKKDVVITASVVSAVGLVIIALSMLLFRRCLKRRQVVRHQNEQILYQQRRQEVRDQTEQVPYPQRRQEVPDQNEQVLNQHKSWWQQYPRRAQESVDANTLARDNHWRELQENLRALMEIAEVRDLTSDELLIKAALETEINECPPTESNFPSPSNL